MNLLPDHLYFGVAPRLLIHCASQLAEMKMFSLDRFAEALGVPIVEAAPVLAELNAAGYVIEAGGQYSGTKKLSQLANANIGGGITRKEAERLLAAVIKKANEINGDTEFSASVECIVVFGSFLTDKEVLGDLDLGVHVREHRRSKQSARELFEMFREGRSPQARVYAALRLRRPRKISVHQISEVLSLKTPYRVVFGSLPAQA